MRQDYILRVRYQNTLPPPPFEPKVLKLPTSLSQFKDASYLSTLIQEQPYKVDIDAELGMPIDLSLIPGIYEGDESLLYAPAYPERLDPEDQALMKGTTESQGAKLATESAFLRRTQYISSELTSTSKMKQQEAERAKRIKDALKVELDPAEQLLAVEKTFSTARRPLSELKHPAKRGLKATKSWTVLPNFELYDQQYVNAKFPSNPAPRTKSNTTAEDQDPRLEVACMIPRIVDDTIDAPENDYIAYFITDEESAKNLIKNNVHGDGAGTTSRYNFVREYDAKKDDVAGEWAIIFNNDAAQYMELGARMNMRGRRRGTQVTSMNEVVEIELRDLNDDERAEQAIRSNVYAREPVSLESTAEIDRQPTDIQDVMEEPSQESLINGNDSGSTGLENDKMELDD